MAKTSKIAKANRLIGHSTRDRHRCKLCGRPRGFIRLFGICRLCFREMVHKGELPGVYKSSK
jgi:small subunit ribosomal protein S14